MTTRGTMDGGRFDDFVRVLGQPIARRQGLRVLLAMTVAGSAGHLALPEAVAQRRRAVKRRLSADGPCGDGSPRHNSCRHDRQCCTGYCDPKRGRCRCRRRGQSCAEDRDCCRRGGQNLTCHNRQCRPAPICTPENCPVCQRCNEATGQCVTDPDQERSCCNGPSGGQWCRSGQCVAVPSEGTYDDCQGVCNGEVQNLCGVDMGCPSCGACPCGPDSCAINGAFGLQGYCVQQTAATCASCPVGSQCCNGRCVEICF